MASEDDTMPTEQQHGRFRAVLVIGVLLAAATVVALWPAGDENAQRDPADLGVPVVYEVRSGQSVRSVGDELAELEVIGSSLRFRRLAEDAGLASLLRPGRFGLATGMTVEEAIAVLAAGPSEGLQRPTVRVQVIEGLMLSDTLETIASQHPEITRDALEAVIAATRTGTEGGLALPEWWPDVADAPDGVELLEGLLWPETYDIFLDETPRGVLQRFVNQTVSEMARIADRDIEVLGVNRSRHDLMIIASLIERETQVDAERALVSGVIHGRLTDGMRLQIEATLSYAKGDLRAISLAADRELESPYNTYRIPALPPGPISGVGRASLLAAAQPDETDFRFYVLAPECDGRHVFSVSFAEHSRNVNAFFAARDAGACT